MIKTVRYDNPLPGGRGYREYITTAKDNALATTGQGRCRAKKSRPLKGGLPRFTVLFLLLSYTHLDINIVIGCIMIDKNHDASVCEYEPFGKPGYNE